MQIKRIDDTFSVTAQITPDDVATLKDNGITTIISARPDGEEDGQPSFEAIKDAATQAGLTAVHIPIVPGQMTEADVRLMADVLEDADGPVLGFCKGGPRAEALYTATGRS